MKTFRQFNDSLNGKLKPIDTRSKLIQWVYKLKFTKVNVIHRNDINENMNEALREVMIRLKKSNGNLTIILIEE